MAKPSTTTRPRCLATADAAAAGPDAVRRELAAERLAKPRRQSTLIRAGFLITLVGIGLLLTLARETSSVWTFVPGLLFIGLGVGVMLTPSVNVVQSSFPEDRQGEISGLSRSVSNLGSSLGTAIAGTILVSDIAEDNQAYALAMVALGVFGLVGLGVALLLPSDPVQPEGALGNEFAPLPGA